MNKIILLIMGYILPLACLAQNANLNAIPITNGNDEFLTVDGRLQPYLDDFLSICRNYNIDYQEKLFKLKNIAVVDTLQLSPHGSTLGMLDRDQNNNVKNILFNWVTLLDEEILKVVAYHEFAHYFLEYKHTCNDCSEIMAAHNPSYFDIIRDWDTQITELFKNAPIKRRQILTLK